MRTMCGSFEDGTQIGVLIEQVLQSRTVGVNRLGKLLVLPYLQNNVEHHVEVGAPHDLLDARLGVKARVRAITAIGGGQVFWFGSRHVAAMVMLITDAVWKVVVFWLVLN